MYRRSEQDGSIYTQEELCFLAADGRDEVFCFCVNYERGARLFIGDIQRIFNNSFEGYLNIYHEENEPEYIYPDSDNQEFELITVFSAMDMVYSLDDPDKATLCNMMNAIENRLVRIW